MARPKNTEAQTDAKAEESKADKFKRLASKRTAKALEAISSLETLGGSGYESTPEQRAKIVGALTARVERVKASLDGTAPAVDGFSL